MEDWILKSFLLFGSLGSRSRRAYGSVWPLSVKIDGVEWKIPTTIDELLYEADEIFKKQEVVLYQIGTPQNDYKKAIALCADFLKRIRCGKALGKYNPSPWGENDHEAGLRKSDKIYRAALGLPLGQRYSSAKADVEYSIDQWERFASPLHFKIIKADSGYAALLLVMPQYAPINGQTVLAKNKTNHSQFKLKLDTALLDELRNAGEDLFELCPNTEYLDSYPHEEE